MPGITGIIGQNSGQHSPELLQSMVECMVHEKFYVTGTHVDDQLGLQCGWICHKESFSDCLPIWNENNDICLIFSGEHYGDLSDIADLKAKGHVCQGNDASYLVHLYEEMGTGFFARLNGWFCGIVLDFREKKLTLFNDRYGLNRIYYHEQNGLFYFSSEAKSLLKILPGLRRLDHSSLGEWLSLDCTLGNKTLFNGISLLPAGSMWVFPSNGHPAKNSYFNGPGEDYQLKLTAEEYYDKFRETFARIVPRYFSGEQEVAISLTGGLDTRMAMAWAHPAPQKLPCYTFGGMYRDSADVRIARQVARICQQRHETIYVNDRFFPDFPELAEKAVYYTDGTVDVSGAVGLFNHRLAREIAPIRVTGNYGDQALRNDRAFNPRSMCEGLFDPEFAALIRNAARSSENIAQDSGLSFFISKQMPWYYYPRFALDSFV